jgi:hypothetical protein
LFAEFNDQLDVILSRRYFDDELRALYCRRRQPAGRHAEDLSRLAPQLSARPARRLDQQVQFHSHEY